MPNMPKHALPSPRRRLLATLAGATLAFGVSATALAAPPKGKGKGKGKGQRIERVCEQLQCTTNQKEELQQVMREMHTDAKAEREAIKTLHKALLAEFKKDEPDEAAMKRIYGQIATHEANLRDRRHDMIMEVHGILTPEQRAKAGRFLLKGKMGGKHGRKAKKNGKNGKNGKPNR